MIEEDFNIFFDADEFAVAVRFGTVTARGLLNMPTEQVGMQLSNNYRLVYETASLPNLVRGSGLVVDGRAYTVREKPGLIGDGKLSEAFLSRD